MSKTLIRRCHRCDHLMEASREISQCSRCHKAFLPLNYFEKVHADTHKQTKSLFSSVEELVEEDLIPGLCVLW